MFPDIKEQRRQEWWAVAHQISSNLLFSRQSCVYDMMWHMGPRGTFTWASKYMEWLAVTIVDAPSSDTVEPSRQLDRITRSNTRDFVYESLCHLKCEDYHVILEPLFPLSVPDTKPMRERLYLRPDKLVRVETIGDISALPDGAYGLPMTSPMPAYMPPSTPASIPPYTAPLSTLGTASVTDSATALPTPPTPSLPLSAYPSFPADVIIQPDTLVQFDHSSCTHKGSVEDIARLRTHLRAPFSQHRLIFLVPRANMESFWFQEDLPDIRQYVTTIEE